jgi:hypothetical protein
MGRAQIRASLFAFTVVLRILDSVIALQEAVEEALGMDLEADEEAGMEEVPESSEATNARGRSPGPQADVEKQTEGRLPQDDEVAGSASAPSVYNELRGTVSAFLEEEARAIADADVTYKGPDGSVVQLPGDLKPVESPAGPLFHSRGSGLVVAYEYVPARGEGSMASMEPEGPHGDSLGSPSSFRSRRGFGSFRVVPIDQLPELAGAAGVGPTKDQSSTPGGQDIQDAAKKRRWWRRRRRKSKSGTGEAVQGGTGPGRGRTAVMTLRHMPKWLVRRIRWIFPLLPHASGLTVLTRWWLVYGGLLPKVGFLLTHLQYIPADTCAVHPDEWGHPDE